MPERPVTSKSRGICKYYQTPRGCFAGASCKFSHAEAYTPFDQNKSCKFFAAGYCRRGSSCWFKHVQPESQSSSVVTAREQNVTPDPSNKDDDHVCCICMEKPVTFGLLAGCSHIFCIECIRGWRDSKGKTEDVVDSGVTKKCPLCRADSRFVTPSSHFYAQGDPAKDATISRYKVSMSRIHCKHFQRSSVNNRSCPFGNDCFYKHQNEDGTNYVFPHGASHYLEDLRRRRARIRWPPRGHGLFMEDGDWVGFGEDDDDDDSLSPETYLDDELGAVLDAFQDALSFRLMRGNTENPGTQQENEDIPAGFASNVANGWSSSGDAMQETTTQGLFTRLATLHLDDSSFHTLTSEDWDSGFDETMPLYQFGSITPSQVAVHSPLPEPGETVSELEPPVRIFRPNTHPLISSYSPHLSSISPLGVSTPIEGHSRFSTVVQHQNHSTIGINDNNQASNPTIVDTLCGSEEPIACEDDRILPRIVSNDDSMDGNAHTLAEEPTAGPSNLGPFPETTPVINLSPRPDLQTQGSDPRDPSEADRHEIDPPVLTDGRGRVVWSSTAAIRGRKGRVGTLLTPQRARRRESSPTLPPVQEITNLAVPGE